MNENELKQNIEISEEDEHSKDLLSDKDKLSSTIYDGEKIIEKEFNSVEEESKIADVKVEGEVTDSKSINVFNPNMKWYIVYVRTGHENKAKQALETKIKTYGMENLISTVLIPSEDVVEMSKGKKKTSSRKFFPGYMLVQMTMNQDTWHFVKSTSRIVGFIGDGTNPPHIKDEDVLKITNQIKDHKIKPTPKVSFEEGETVRVIEGPFTNFTGIVEEVRPDKAKLRVLVSIFGRSTPVELEFIQVEKI